MIIGPHTQKEQSKIIGDRVRFYITIYIPVLFGALLIIVLSFYSNYRINYLQEDYYVYGNYKFKLNPEFEEDIPLFKKFVSDTILPVPVNAKYVDLRNKFSYIKNQGTQGACLAFALSSILEYLQRVRIPGKADFSEAFLYYEARKKAGQEDEDNGSYFVYAIECLKNEGICHENFMPYNEYDHTTPPSEKAFDDALQYRVTTVNTVNQELKDLKSALYNGYPIVISVAMFSSFGNGKNGVIPMPSKGDYQNYQYSGQSHLFHAMVIVGYDDNRKLFIVRNSWGESFGDNGYCYLPYDYITDFNLTNYACTITEVKNKS